MALNFSWAAQRLPLMALAAVVTLAVLAGYVLSDSEGEAMPISASGPNAGSLSAASAGSATAGGDPRLAATASAPGTSMAAAAAAAAGLKPFTASEAASALAATFGKIVKGQPLSASELEELRLRLLAGIEGDPAVAGVVAHFYAEMPAQQGMERDMLRSLLVSSEAGRRIVLQEANNIWENKSEAKFAEMYETYFNLPGMAPPEVMTRVLADLGKGTAADERAAVARLNFVGTLEVGGVPDAANVRAEALQVLNNVAQGDGSELVRALAVQKLYRLNSPAEAANIAVAQLSKGASSDLLRETLSSIASGDVELTPVLRSSLSSMAKRPGISDAQQQQLRALLH